MDLKASGLVSELFREHLDLEEPVAVGRMGGSAVIHLTNGTVLGGGGFSYDPVSYGIGGISFEVHKWPAGSETSPAAEGILWSYVFIPYHAIGMIVEEIKG